MVPHCINILQLFQKNTLGSDLNQSCFKFQVAKVTGGAASKLSKIRVVRKSIARVYIVMHQKQKENLRKFYKVSRIFKGVPLNWPNGDLKVSMLFILTQSKLSLRRNNKKCALLYISTINLGIQLYCTKRTV